MRNNSYNMKKRIVISGYYGFGNTGDEAVLAGILATFKQVGLDVQVTVLSSDPAHTMAEHPGVESVHRYHIGKLISVIRKADLLISGGGSLLQDVTSTRSARYYLGVLQLAQFLKRKTAIYAQGIGPLNNPSIRTAVARTLNETDLISVRDENSKTLLESVGVKRPIHVTSDPSFVVEADTEAADSILAQAGLNGRELVGVSLRPWPNEGVWLEEVAEGIRQASKELNVDFIFIPMQESEDGDICQSISCGTVIREAGGVRAVKGIISRCSLIVGMRLHSLIFAASEVIPFVPIVYDPKVSAFASMVNQLDGIDIESVSADAMKNAIISAWQQRKEPTEQLGNRVSEMKRSALESGELIKGLLS